MFLFKDNFALFVHDIDKSVRFYQDSFNLRMYGLSKDGNEVLMENMPDNKLLRLVKNENFSPSEISVYSNEISSAYNKHYKQNIIKDSDSMSAKYSVKDPDKNIINVIGEIEKISFNSDDTSVDTDDNELLEE